MYRRYFPLYDAYVKRHDGAQACCVFSRRGSPVAPCPARLCSAPARRCRWTSSTSTRATSFPPRLRWTACSTRWATTSALVCGSSPTASQSSAAGTLLPARRDELGQARSSLCFQSTFFIFVFVGRLWLSARRRPFAPTTAFFFPSFNPTPFLRPFASITLLIHFHSPPFVRSVSKPRQNTKTTANAPLGNLEAAI